MHPIEQVHGDHVQEGVDLDCENLQFLIISERINPPQLEIGFGKNEFYRVTASGIVSIECVTAHLAVGLDSVLQAFIVHLDYFQLTRSSLHDQLCTVNEKIVLVKVGDEQKLGQN